MRNTQTGDDQLERQHRQQCPHRVYDYALGDVLVFSPYLVHASTPNTSDRTRLTLVFRYDDATQFDWMIDGENPFARLNIQQTPY